MYIYLGLDDWAKMYIKSAIDINIEIYRDQ